MADINDLKTEVDIARVGASDIRTTIVFRAPQGLLTAIDEAAQRRGLSRNAFMVKALSRVIAGEQ